jgi:hypothetical protein
MESWVKMVAMRVSVEKCREVNMLPVLCASLHTIDMHRT